MSSETESYDDYAVEPDGFGDFDGGLDHGAGPAAMPAPLKTLVDRVANEEPVDDLPDTPFEATPEVPPAADVPPAEVPAVETEPEPTPAGPAPLPPEVQQELQVLRHFAQQARQQIAPHWPEIQQLIAQKRAGAQVPQQRAPAPAEPEPEVDDVDWLLDQGRPTIQGLTSTVKEQAAQIKQLLEWKGKAYEEILEKQREDQHNISVFGQTKADLQSKHPSLQDDGAWGMVEHQWFQTTRHQGETLAQAAARCAPMFRAPAAAAQPNDETPAPPAPVPNTPAGPGAPGSPSKMEKWDFDKALDHFGGDEDKAHEASLMWLARKHGMA